MGGTACTEPQCLYKGAFYLYFKRSISAFVIENNLRRAYGHIILFIFLFTLFCISFPFDASENTSFANVRLACEVLISTFLSSIQHSPLLRSM